MEIVIRDNVPKPEKKEKYEFAKIKVGGAMIATPTGKETLKSIAATIKAAVVKFKKTNPMNLSVDVREDLSVVSKDFEGKSGVIVRHNPVEEEKNENNL